MKMNYLAAVVAGVSTFIVGALWCSPLLFQKAWMEANGFTDADLTKSHGPQTFVIAFVLSLLMAVNLSAFLASPDTTAKWGATAGFLAGLGWVAFGLAVVALFEGRPLSYIVINGGYWVVSFVVMGLIIGAWR